MCNKGVPGIEAVTQGRGGEVSECLKKNPKSISKVTGDGTTHPQALDS